MYSIIWMCYNSLSIHLLLPSFAIKSLWVKQLSTSMYSLCVCRHTFSSALGKPKSKAVGSNGKSTFSFLRKHQMVFQNGCTILHRHQQWLRIRVASHFYQHLLLPVFWNLVILTGGQRYLSVVLISISLMMSSDYPTIALISQASKGMLKILQARLQQHMDRELPDVQAGFRKGRGTRD